MKHRHENIERLKLLRFWLEEVRKAKQGLSLDEPATNTDEYDQFKKGYNETNN